MDRRKPDLIFIGPYKSGSEYLRAYFDQHPEIVWTRQAQFFLADANRMRMSEYPEGVPAEAEKKYFIDMFEGVAIGYIFREAKNWPVTGFQPFRPLSDEVLIPDQMAVAARIHAAAPDAKILMCLRNQVDWLRSSYLHHIYFLAPKDRTFSQFLNTLEGKCAMDAGHYDRIVQAYATVFGREQVHVMLIEEVASDEEKTLRRLCDFMELPYVPYPAEQKKQNSGKGLLAGNAISRLSRLGLSDSRLRGLGRIVRPLIPWLKPFITYDVINTTERRVLGAVYAASNFRTARLTGLDLARAGYPM